MEDDCLIKTPIRLLPIQLAVTEIVEFMLFLLAESIQMGKSTRDCGIKVKIQTAGIEDSVDQRLWAFIKVKCLGRQSTTISVKDFISRCGTGIMKVLQDMEACYVENIFYCEMAHDTDRRKTECCHVTMTKQREELLCIKEIKEEKCKDISVFIKVFQNKRHLLSECAGIYNYLHKLKIVNQELLIGFNLHVGEAVTETEYEFDNTRVPGCRKLSSHIGHFVRTEEVPEGVMRIVPKYGAKFVLRGVQLANQCHSNLRLTATAALLPPPEENSKNFNHLCKHLKILFYGPGNIPLLLSGLKQSGFRLDTIVNLEEYNLRIDGEEDQKASSETVNMDFCYRLKACSGDEMVSDDDIQTKQFSILLVLHLEKYTADRSPSDVLGDLALLDAVREKLPSMLLKYKVKVRKAAAAALNKVLYNFTIHNQRQGLLQSVIPTVASALHQVVKNTTCDPFRYRCFSALQVTDTNELKAAVSDRLWDLAKNKFAVNRPCEELVKEKKDSRQTSVPVVNIPEDPNALSSTHPTAEMSYSMAAALSLSQIEDMESFESLGLDLLTDDLNILDEGLAGIDDITSTEDMLQHLVQDAIENTAAKQGDLDLPNADDEDEWLQDFLWAS